MRLRVFPLFLLSLFSFLAAEIFECENLEDAKKHIPENGIVFCEVDEVLLRGNTIASRLNFFDALQDDLLSEGYEPEQIANKLYPLWVDVHQVSEVSKAGPEVASFVEWLNNRSKPSYIMTYRGPQLTYQTLDQLHQQDLSLEPLKKPNHLFEDQLSTFFEGILFIHPVSHKGEYLSKFLEYCQEPAKHIVCIDPKLIDLVDLKETLESKGIKFTGIYLNRPKQTLTEWEKKIGELQLQYSKEILPNDLAKCLVESNDD